MYAHFHTYSGKHQEGGRVPAADAIPFWERVLVLSRERADQEEAEARKKEASLREAFEALEGVR
eukprot:14628757-Heterocapsa_arctica.AAC.1